MKCPVCKMDSLGPITLVEDLPANQCSNCGGVWIDSNAYLAWLRGRGHDLPPKPLETKMNPTWNVDELKLCPNSGHIMARYKIFPDTDFYLDRCRHCNGIWFDKYEWEALLERNLHDNINEFFTRPWQDDIRAAETRNHMDNIYLEKFGTEDYEHIKQIRAWLKDHPKRGMLLAFLQSDDPYKV